MEAATHPSPVAEDCQEPAGWVLTFQEASLPKSITTSADAPDALPGFPAAAGAGCRTLA
jgi:hypothetical protein